MSSDIERLMQHISAYSPAELYPPCPYCGPSEEDAYIELLNRVRSRDTIVACSVIEGIRDPSPHVQLLSVCAYRFAGCDLLVMPLIRATRYRHVDREFSWCVRWWAVVLLGLMGRTAEQAVPAICRLTRSRSADLRAAACWALGEITRGDARATRSLTAAIIDADQDVREAAGRAIGGA